MYALFRQNDYIAVADNRKRQWHSTQGNLRANDRKSQFASVCYSGVTFPFQYWNLVTFVES